MFKSRCTVAVVCVLLSGTTVADTLHVPGDFPTIQEAINAAMDGDEVEVHPGTYNEAIDFLGKAITVRSSDGPDVTTIDATGLNDSVVKCVSGEGPETVLQGFTITGGSGPSGGGMRNISSSPTVTNCTFSGNTLSKFEDGGGMYNSGGSPAVTNCTFSANTANRGGGMFNFGGSPTVTNCVFSKNQVSGPCDFGGVSCYGAGGGMYNGNSSPTVTNCAFTANSAGSGGGMSNHDSSLIITDCVFTGNSAVAINDAAGGGMYNVDSNLTLTNCDFTANTASVGGGLGNAGATQVSVSNCTFSGNAADFDGGGMYNNVSSPTVTNCAFTGNLAFDRGGGMYNGNSSPTVTNSTFSGNGTFGLDGGGIYNTNRSNPTVTNCILWENSGDEILDAGTAESTVNYSDVQDGWFGAGSNNIDADPMFVDPDNEDYHLSAGSPCADAGNNWGVPIDADDYDGDGNTAELFPVDLDGNPRFNADEADFDPGCGVPVVVDMGAYEYQFDPVEDVIFADLNGDGVVGILDLLAVLAAWGDARNNCLGDLDIDGDVGILDLLTLLAHWG
ncbi:MAG: right-handed parallel beta-helix repeat-containing protein [Planctomycetes bacterium]|nr:right-handed parallel beta-helix repeat-containing protein [Planctomycetota bacterium]